MPNFTSARTRVLVMSNRNPMARVRRGMKRVCGILIFLILLVCVLPAQARAKLVFSCNQDNDLFRLLPGSERVDTPAEAIERADEGTGVLILADGYPQQRTAIPADLFDRARAKHLRLYVEYP